MNAHPSPAPTHPLKLAVSHSPSPFPPATVDPQPASSTPTPAPQIASTNGSSAPVASADDTSAVLQAVDAHKLAVVLASLASDEALLEQSVPSLGVSLKGILTAPSTTLNQIRNVISHLALPAADEPWRAIALALVVELEGRYKSPAAHKRELESARSQNCVKRQKYMLHRGLNNLDLFTAHAELTDEEAAQLASFDDTDLVAVQSPIESELSSSSKPVPALSAVLPPPSTRARRTPAVHPKAAPVELLYYDPFSSFAPTHDSTGATLTHAQTLASGVARRRLARWEEEVRKPLGEEELRPLLEEAKWEDGEDEKMENDEDDREAAESRTWAELGHNSLRIAQLVREQWARLAPQQQPDTTPPAEAGTTPKPAPIGEAEQQTARALVRSLSKLVSSVAPSSAQRKAIPLAPTQETVRSETVRLMAALRQKRATRQGLLDPNNFRAIKESALTRPIITAPPPPPQQQQQQQQQTTMAGANGTPLAQVAPPVVEATLIPKLEE